GLQSMRARHSAADRKRPVRGRRSSTRALARRSVRDFGWIACACAVLNAVPARPHSLRSARRCDAPSKSRQPTNVHVVPRAQVGLNFSMRNLLLVLLLSLPCVAAVAAAQPLAERA